jgi:DNA repair photolyase
MQSNLLQIEQQPSVAIKGCSYIYVPAGQAGEYAPLAANPYRGCGYGCAYCYVPMALRMKREEFDAGASPRRNYLDNLRKDARKYKAAGIEEQVMRSFTTDVYNPFDRAWPRSLRSYQRRNEGAEGPGLLQANEGCLRLNTHKP